MIARIKAMAHALAVLLTSPWWALARLEAAAGCGEQWFAASSELLSLVPGRTGQFLRRAFYCMTLESCTADCLIGFGTTIAHREVRIGRGVYVGNRCSLGQVILEDDVVMGSNVDLLSGRRQHHFDDPSRPIQAQGGTFQRIRIGRDSWIGNSSVIMADVGPGCVVGAGAVVVKPVPGGSVVGGNPARVLRSRELSSAPISNHSEGEAATLHQER